MKRTESELTYLVRTYKECSEHDEDPKDVLDACKRTLTSLPIGWSVDDAVSLIEFYNSASGSGETVEDLADAVTSTLKASRVSRATSKKVLEWAEAYEEASSSKNNFERVSDIAEYMCETIKSMNYGCEHQFRAGSYCANCGSEKEDEESQVEDAVEKKELEKPRGWLERFLDW